MFRFWNECSALRPRAIETLNWFACNRTCATGFLCVGGLGVGEPNATNVPDSVVSQIVVTGWQDMKWIG